MMRRITDRVTGLDEVRSDIRQRVDMLREDSQKWVESTKELTKAIKELQKVLTQLSEALG